MTSYDPATALLIVDLQNDFADPAGGLPVRDGAAVVPVANEEIGRALAAGAQVVYTQDWHPDVTPHFAKDGGVWPVHCVQGTWGAELHPGLLVRGPVVRKGANGEDGYSGFTMRDPVTGETIPTELSSLLERGGVRRVVICGLATDYCVKSTALDSQDLGFETVVLESGVRAVDLAAGDGELALREMQEAGVRVEESASGDSDD
jgi:nicotinamidase/pyrazinamidase